MAGQFKRSEYYYIFWSNISLSFLPFVILMNLDLNRRVAAYRRADGL